MALTPSKMLPLNTIAPDFVLMDVNSGKTLSLDELRGKKATVIMFICNHCPFVQHVKQQLRTLSEDYKEKDIGFIAINSNDVDAYPEDSPENMKAMMVELGCPFVYLYDETQKVAKDYKAACTPDFFIFDAKLHCVYRGQLDDSRPGNDIPVTGQDIRNALDNILQGKPVDQEQKASIGCNIKWKK